MDASTFMPCRFCLLGPSRYRALRVLKEDADGNVDRAALLHTVDRSMEIHVVPFRQLGRGVRRDPSRLEPSTAPVLAPRDLGLLSKFRCRHDLSTLRSLMRRNEPDGLKLPAL